MAPRKASAKTGEKTSEQTSEQTFAQTFKKKESRWASAGAKKDFLMDLPPKNFHYLNDKDENMFPAQDGIRFSIPGEGGAATLPEGRKHPRIEKAVREGTWTWRIERWWTGVPFNVNIPTAGIPLDERPSKPKPKKRKAEGPPPEPTRRSKRLAREAPDAAEQSVSGDATIPASEPAAITEPNLPAATASPTHVEPETMPVTMKPALKAHSQYGSEPAPEPEVQSQPDLQPEPLSVPAQKPQQEQQPESQEDVQMEAEPLFNSKGKEKGKEKGKGNLKANPKAKAAPKATRSKQEAKSRITKIKLNIKPTAKASKKLENIASDLGTKLPELREHRVIGQESPYKVQQQVPATPLWEPQLPQAKVPLAEALPDNRFAKMADFAGLRPEPYRPAPANFFIPQRPSLANWHESIADEVDLQQEEGFHSRPSIKLVMPDHLKALLVDDWENVTKNNQLVPLPHPHPVNDILNDYLNFEGPKRGEGTPSRDILEETIAGVREYFDKSLGRILLYRFERLQYAAIRSSWDASTDDSKKQGPCTTYGAEHLCRLLVSLPELIGQTNMDQQSVNRLREELINLTNWLAKHTTKYFVSEYESPVQEYIDKARSI